MAATNTETEREIETKTETKNNDESTPTDDPNTTDTTAAQTAAAAAYYQQYGYQYGYYPYNYGYAYNGYNGYDANQTTNTDAYQQYYQQYQQQLLSQSNHTADNTATNGFETNTEAQPIDTTQINNNNNDNNDDKTALIATIEHIPQQPTKDLKDWTHFEVAEWVETVQNGGFIEHAQAFIENEINGNVLYDITPQQLQLGLYMNNMVKRLEFHALIQTLKIKQNDTNDVANPIKSISELQRAPPIKRKKKNKKKSKKKNEKISTDSSAHNITATATATFLKLGTQQAMQNNKSSSQLLVDKMAMNNKRKLNELDKGGMQHRIEWKYRDEGQHKQYDDLNIEMKDKVLFEWEYTRNVWKFANKTAYDENNFNPATMAEELCGSNCNLFVWRPKKVGMHYFGCQVANCASSGNMKIRVNVVQNQGDENPTKKRRVE